MLVKTAEPFPQQELEEERMEELESTVEGDEEELENTEENGEDGEIDLRDQKNVGDTEDEIGNYL